MLPVQVPRDKTCVIARVERAVDVNDSVVFFDYAQFVDWDYLAPKCDE
jgi:hypothetical protein